MCNSLLQDSEDTYNNLQAKLQQLQKQVATNEVENSHLATEKKYFIKTIASLKLDLERYQLEMLLSLKGCSVFAGIVSKYMLEIFM